jgi:hypothetical protein
MKSTKAACLALLAAAALAVPTLATHSKICRDLSSPPIPPGGPHLVADLSSPPIPPGGPHLVADLSSPPIPPGGLHLVS